jgi:hypothetical protein
MRDRMPRGGAGGADSPSCGSGLAPIRRFQRGAAHGFQAYNTLAGSRNAPPTSGKATSWAIQLQSPPSDYDEGKAQAWAVQVWRLPDLRLH